jgi:malate permease and related proteins
VPLMLMMLGSSLARLRIASLGRAAGVAALRLGMGALIGAAAAALFHLDGVARPVLILQSAMPVAVYNYLFALRWNNEPEEIAGLVVLSTIGAMITLPALLSLLLG